MAEKSQPKRLIKVLSKYSKHSRWVEEIKNQYNELSEYSKCNRSVGEAENQYNELSTYLKPWLEETIAERVKLMPRKEKKELESKSSLQTSY